VNWLAVIAGSAVGGALRYGVSLAFARPASGFPWATFVVNVTGALALGFLARYFAPPNGTQALFLFLTVGLCGGYTTFSAYALDIFTLMQSGAVGRACVYAISSVAISLIALVAGYFGAQHLRPV
jgi:CrcB protein